MLEKDLKIGIVGCGHISNTHVDAIKNIFPNARIAVCDPEVGKAELFIKEFDLSAYYQNIDDLIAGEELDTVHILSPPHLHFEHTLLCLQSGCHVLVEKPVVFKVSEVKKLLAASKANKKVLCANHTLIRQPSTLKMMEYLNSNNSDSREKVLQVRSFYGMNKAMLSPKFLSPDHWKHSIPGGPVIDTLIHPITLAVEMTGKPTSLDVAMVKSDEGIDELNVSWSGVDAIASLTVSTQAQPFMRYTEIFTDKGLFVIDHTTETLVRLDEGFGPGGARKLIKNFSHSYQITSGTIGTVYKVMRKKLKDNPGTRDLVKTFYDHLLGKGESPVTEDNIINSTIALEQTIRQISKKEQSYAREESKTQQTKQPVNKIDDSKEKILVTGASGLLGYEICKELSEIGHPIIAQVRRSTQADKLSLPNVRKIYDDFSFENVNYERLTDEVKIVIHSAHAAGAKTWEQFKRVNADATLELYEAAAKAGCEYFVFISSVAVYGVHQKGKLTVNEDTPTTKGHSSWDFYIRSKSLAENMLLERAEKGGPKLIIIRPGVLYLPDGTRLVKKSIPLKKKRLMISFGKGKNRSPMTRADVLADAICQIVQMEERPSGIFNLTGNPDMSSREFLDDRLKELGIDPIYINLPAFAFRSIGTAMEWSYFLLRKKSPPKVTRYIIDSSTRNIIYDTTKAEKYLGWDPEAAIAK